MSVDISMPSSFDGTVRIFPLPSVVLYPHVMLPLHIFEPRYRQMTEDALAGDRLIAMALFRPGWESDYEATPAIYPIACLGKIVADQRLDDGRYNLLLRGLSRVRVSHESQTPKLYRSAQVDLLYETAVPAPDQAEPIRAELTRWVSKWLSTMGMAAEQVMKLLDSELPIGALGDIVSFALPIAPEFKQELLEELNVDRRLRRLLNHLENTPPPKPEAMAARKFPPDFSHN